MVDIKYPRLMVSKTRHAKLLKESRTRKISMQQIGEEKFKQAEAKK